MTIDKDTPLEEILNSAEVIDITSNLQSTLVNKLNGKSSALESAMSGGLGENVLIDGEALFYNSAVDVKGKIDTVTQEVNSAFNSAATLSEEKETEELNTLKTAVTKYIEEINTKISNLKAEFRNITSEPGFDDKTSAEKAAIYGNYYGDSGSIVLAEKEKALYQEKLEAIQRRLNKVNAWKSYEDAAEAGYSNVMTRNEFLRRKAAGSEDLKDYETYEDYLAAMQDKYLGVTEESSDTWKSYEDAAAAGHAEVMTREEFLRRKAAGSQSVSGFATYEDYLAAMQNKYEGRTATEAAGGPVITGGGPDLSTIPEDSWSPQTSYVNPGNTVVFEESHDEDGNLVSRASSRDGKVLYYTVSKDGQVYWYDANRNEITPGTALAMQSVQNFGKVDSEQWQRETTITVPEDTSHMYTLNSNYKDMKIELYTTSSGETIYFKTTDENGEEVYYDGNYNKISSERAQEIYQSNFAES